MSYNSPCLVQYIMKMTYIFVLIMYLTLDRRDYTFLLVLNQMLPVFGQERLDIVDVEGLCLDLSLGEILCDVVRFETPDSQFSQLLQRELKEKITSCMEL